jgi:hypothetical protein
VLRGLLSKKIMFKGLTGILTYVRNEIRREEVIEGSPNPGPLAMKLRIP